MDPGGINVRRTLPIDGALLSDVLLRLRRDSNGSVLRWTLGDRGAAEIDVCFEAGDGFEAGRSEWTTTARLWNGTGLAMTAATVRLLASGPDEVGLTLEPMPNTAPEMSDLAQAAADEFAEELLWHATRAGLTPRG